MNKDKANVSIISFLLHNTEAQKKREREKSLHKVQSMMKWQHDEKPWFVICFVLLQDNEAARQNVGTGPRSLYTTYLAGKPGPEKNFLKKFTLK